MSSTVLLLFLFCGLTLAQDGANEGEVTVETQSCFPDMCKFLVEFGAMKEKQRAMETKLQQTEIKLQQTDTKLQQTDTKFQKTDTKLQQTDTKLQQTETKLQQTETKLQQTETKLQQTEMKMKETENQLVELKSKGATKVAFSTAVSGTGAYGSLDTEMTLIYGRVILNMGDAYNQTTGIFTAPVAGVYYFSFFYHAEQSYTTKMYLYKNDGVMVAAYEHTSRFGGIDGGGNAVFLQLQQGDQVFVKMTAKSRVWKYDHYTTFSGFLVTET